ncbi:MAG: glycosyltransferase [Chloroflexota bacterium]|nr:glycosyltransferase [Chloroflexota bacterium]
MKVIQANKAYFPHVGGIETIVQQLAEGFVSRHGATSSVIVCNDQGHTCSEMLNGVEVSRVGTIGRIASLPISPSYPGHLLQQQGDILQIHEPFLLGSLGYLLRPRRAKRQFQRLVVWWHSDIVRQRAFARLYTPLLRRILREADAVIAATPHHISSSPFLNEVWSKCHTIHFGVDMARFADSPVLQRRIADIKAKYPKPIILFTGRLVYYKGANYLIEAMRELPDAHLVIVGDGPLRSELEQLAASCAKNITFIHFLSEPDWVAMFHACDIFVLPSVEKSEAFGIVQLEAMACGKPVITANLPTGVTYVNQDGITGLVVEARDAGALAAAIKRLLAEPEFRHRLGKQAQDRIVREFTIEHMVDQTMGLYTSLLG